MHQVLQLQNSDHSLCCARHWSLDAGRLARDLTTSLDRLPRGATAISDLSPHFVDAVERAWVWATLKYGAGRIRTGHVLLALLKTPGLRSVTIGISREFEKIKVDQLTDELEQIVAGSPEDQPGWPRAGAEMTSALTSGEPGEASDALAPSRRWAGRKP